jgi:hypothetical protein
MPSPGATPTEGFDALDLGRDAQGRWLIGTRYSDGSYVVWDATTEEEVAYIEPGRADPADLGGGRAAVINPDGSLTAFDIASPPPQFQGAPAPGAPGGVTAPAAPAPGTPVGNPISRLPGGYGSRGFLPSGEPRPTNLLQGTTDFGRGPTIDIRPEYAEALRNPALAPGYLEGSGSYNQYPLNKEGLFGTIPGQSGVVALRYGLGGTGDPTTGGEVQTPQRWITGNPNDNAQAMQGDPKWRQTGGTWRGGGGGGGFDPALAAAAPAYAYGGGGGGMGGGFFGSNVTSNWGRTAETAGKDYIATLFLRSDTPTGIGTPAWSAPPQMWQGLLQEIAAGRIYVTDPQAWQMLKEKTGATPQSIGGAALGGQNVQPGGAVGAGGTGSSTEDAIANGNAAEAADRAAYWAYQQSLLRQGDQRIALEEARDAWGKAYQTAGLTGQFGGADTMAMQQQRFAQGVSEAGLTGTYQGAPTQQAIQTQNANALALLGLQASLKGPRNWATYQSTFNSTPGGLQDVMAAYQGRYQLPGATGAQSQAQGGRNTVAGLGGDILSGTYGNDGTQQPQAMGNPRQVDLQNWARMQPSQREMILGQFENEGWYGEDVENLMKGAAPRAPGASSANYNFLAR